jgi:hypothetical protein
MIYSVVDICLLPSEERHLVIKKATQKLAQLKGHIWPKLFLPKSLQMSIPI